MIPPRFDPRTSVGRLRGLGSCSNCGGTWNWRRSFDIPLSGHNACFPICIECALKMTADQIMAACEELWASWGESAITQRDRAYAKAFVLKYKEGE